MSMDILYLLEVDDLAPKNSSKDNNNWHTTESGAGSGVKTTSLKFDSSDEMQNHQK